MVKRIFNWMRSEEGQAMSEYGLVLAIAAVGVIAVLVAFREQLKALFNSVVANMRAETPTTPTTTP